MNGLTGIFQNLSSVLFLIFALVGYLAAGIVAWTNVRWRIGNAEKSLTSLQLIVKDQLELTRAVEINSVKLAEIAKNTERRLQLVEDRLK